jgi:hypothetical protein
LGAPDRLQNRRNRRIIKLRSWVFIVSVFRRTPLLVFILAILAALSFADDKAGKSPRLSSHSRMEIIRSMDAEVAFARRPFPMGTKGLTITPDGKITPDEQQLAAAMATAGPSAHPGDRIRITNLEFKGNTIRFEINGGPKKKEKWYQRVQVGMGGAMPAPVDPDPSVNARGTYITLIFPGPYVPDITVAELKKYLLPLLDFSSLSATQAYVDTLPPKAKEAIKNHQVLVGMNREMVDIALGRPGKKYRDKDEQGRAYEEWIYGEPPKPVEFVRFVGDEVVRVEIMQVNGEKIVKTQKEIEVQEAAVKKPQAQPQQQQQASTPPKPTSRPTLRRPGEEDPNQQDSGTLPDAGPSNGGSSQQGPWSDAPPKPASQPTQPPN